MLAGKRILVVDDEQAIASSLAMIFASQGYDCKPANSVEDAIEAVSSWSPDLAVVDVHLREADGVALAIDLQRQYPGCKVALFTGMNSVAPLLAEAHNAGYDFAIIPKPIHPAEMLKLVAEFLTPAAKPELD